MTVTRCSGEVTATEYDRVYIFHRQISERATAFQGILNH